MHPETEDEISLKEVALTAKAWGKYLFSFKNLITAALFLGGLAGFFYAFTRKPMYTATLSFVLEDEKGKGSSAMSLASQFGFDMGGSSNSIFSGENLIELMKSRSLTVKTLLNPLLNDKDQSLAEMYIEFNHLRANWKDNPALETIQFKPNMEKHSIAHDSILGIIYEKLITENLNVNQKDKKTSIIYIEVKSKNELFSKYYAETLSREVSEFYVDTKSRKALQNLKILTKQTDSVRAELNTAIAGVATANDNTFNLNPALNINRVPSARRQVDVQANTAILTELVKNLEMARVTLRKETPLIQVIDTPILPLKKEKLGKLKGMLTGAFLGGLLTVLFLSFKRLFQKIQNS
jgi:uncharacterized protein involved in exopolysaccharide biosynthesis